MQYIRMYPLQKKKEQQYLGLLSMITLIIYYIIMERNTKLQIYSQFAQEDSFSKLYHFQPMEMEENGFGLYDFSRPDGNMHFSQKNSVQIIENEKNDEISQKSHDLLIESENLISKQSQLISTSTRTNLIQVDSKDIQSLKEKMTQQRKNNRFETQNTGKHLRVITLDILRVLSILKVLSINERKAVIKFKNSNGGRADFKQLMQHPIIKKKSYQFFSSSEFVKKILQSPKMTMKNKIILLKYLQQLRSVTYDANRQGWKLKKDN